MRNFKRDFQLRAFQATIEGEGKVICARTGKVQRFKLSGRADPGLIERVGRAVFGLAWLRPGFLGAVTHNATLRNTLCDAVVDAIDAGAGAGILRIETTAAALLATLTFSDPAFGAASGGTATANAITDETNATAGTAAQFETRDSNAVSVFLGNVQTSGGDINLSSLTIGSGDTVSISSLTYSAPP